MWRKVVRNTSQVMVLIYMVLPLVLLLMMSFSKVWRWPELFPQNWDLQAWQYVFSPNTNTWQILFTSLWIAMIVALINLFIALPAAEVLARRNFVGKLWVEGLLMAPLIVSPIVSMMGFHSLFIWFGWSDTLFGVVLAHLIPTFPYMLRCLMISYRTLGLQWEEQATMLSSSPRKRFMYVVLPHLLPGIVAGIGLSMLVSLSQYLVTFLIGGGQVMTISLVLFPYVNQGDSEIAAVYSVLFSVLALVSLYGSGLILKLFYRDGFSYQKGGRRI